MNTMPSDEAYKSLQVIELLAVANEYCLFLEKAEEYDKGALLDFISKICPLLYLKGSLLPVVMVEDQDANERFVTQEQWETIFLSIRTIIGEEDLFWIAVPEDEHRYTLIKASLAEHLADIYQDMKDFVLLYQKNLQASKENAASEIKSLFPAHWGLRIVQIQRHLHVLVHGEPEEGNPDLADFLEGI